jgi:hypothetical protein
MIKLTKEQFIEKAKIIHYDKYDYNLFEYEGNKKKGLIICKKHEIFKKSPFTHITKKEGCPLCKKIEMNNYDHNLKIDNNLSYMIGLFQTDGSMYSSDRNRGNFSLSLSVKDEDIIYKIKKLIPYNSNISKRIKKTQFKRNNKIYKYNNEIISLTISNKYFRDFLLRCNIPYGKKSKIISPPAHLENFSKIDYIRGLFDGDGSLGFTKDDFPFVSFTTESDNMKDYILDFFSEITEKYKKEINRNKRDNIYQILMFKEDAIKFCEIVYYKDCLSLNRKYNIAIDIINWIRPIEMKRNDFERKKWTKEEDKFILLHKIEDSVYFLKRTENSVKIRIIRLKNNFLY